MAIDHFFGATHEHAVHYLEIAESMGTVCETNVSLTDAYCLFIADTLPEKSVSPVGFIFEYA